MSPSKKDRDFPQGSSLLSDAQLAEIIASALRQDFGDTPSAIKQIGRLTSANLRAIKNWYIAKNAPSSRYLLILARTSPSILRFILMQVGGEDLWDVFELFHRSGSAEARQAKVARATPLPAEDVTKDVTSSSPKERGQWFLSELAKGRKATARELSEHWSVDLRTARRDISLLVKSRQALFRGSKRYGWYEIGTVVDS